MMRVAARYADEVVLNLAPLEHVSAVRKAVDAEAAVAPAGPVPSLAVWVPVALKAGSEAPAQLASQLAIYLGAPGYGEMFSKLGFAELVRAGARRRPPLGAVAVPCRSSSVERVCAIGSPDEIMRRISAYHQAGADVVGVAPATAEDPAGRAVLRALSEVPFSRSNGGGVMTLVNAQCRLAARPVGLPKASDWDYVEEPAREPGDGEFLVRVEYISLDPAMRGVDERRPLVHAAGGDRRGHARRRRSAA